GVGFAGTGRSDREDDVVVSCGLDEACLVRRLCLDNAALGREEDDVARIVTRVSGAVAEGEQRQDGIDVVLGEIPVAVEDQDELVQDALHLIDHFLFAAEKDLVSSGCDLRPGKRRFNPAQEYVVEAEEEEGLSTLNRNTFI